MTTPGPQAARPTTRYLGEERRKQPPPDEAPGGDRLSGAAWTYLAAIYSGTVLAPPVADGHAWFAFAIFTSLATASQMFAVKAPSRHSYHATPAFLLSAALLLPPSFFAPLVVIPLALEWARYRYPWYIQTFNICTYLLNILGAHLVYDWISPGGLDLSWAGIAGAAAAGLTFTAMNHLMVAIVLWLARRISPALSGVLSAESLQTDLALIGVGIGIAVFWTIQPALIVLQIIPLFLFYRALSVPLLAKEAHYDAKTGLLTASRFMEILEEHTARAARDQQHALSLIMADLDFFRGVNDSLGHLAGDQVLRAVATVLRQTLRQGDFIGRFGGEEFVILLPNTEGANAMRAAERLRAAIECAQFQLPGRLEPVPVTVSLGVASFPDPCPDVRALLHMADLAVYKSKRDGRNRASMASGEQALPVPQTGPVTAVTPMLSPAPTTAAPSGTTAA